MFTKELFSCFNDPCHTLEVSLPRPTFGLSAFRLVTAQVLWLVVQPETTRLGYSTALQSQPKW
jgi:hypothetical protein